MPQIIKIDFDHPDSALENSTEILKRGGVVSFPTETFYGLGANALDEQAVKKIYQIKKRELNKPLLVFVASEHQLPLLTSDINKSAKILMDHFWPGPLTLLFKASSSVPKCLIGDTGKIGVRVSGSNFISQLCQMCGFPITGSSANISDSPDLLSAEEIRQTLGDKVDLILDGGKSGETLPSTVLDVSEKVPLLVRPGIVEKKAIEEVLNLRVKTK